MSRPARFVPTYTPHPNPGKTWAVNMTYAVSPTIVNQLTLGWSWNDYAYDLNANQLDRGNMLNPPSFHNFAKDPLYNQPPTSRPESPVGQVLPGGLPHRELWRRPVEQRPTSASPSATEPAPTTISTPCTKSPTASARSIGKHNFKVGIAWEWGQKVETSGGNSQGTYNFNGADDPFFQSNTLDGFANAYLGNFKTYTEGQRVLGLKSSVGLEAFVQDSWRVHRRLTLDLGVRFSHLPAMQDVSGNTTMFLPSSYNKALAERIFYPYCSVSAAAGQCPQGETNTPGIRRPTRMRLSARVRAARAICTRAT